MIQRPDLSETPAAVVAYIEALEAALARQEEEENKSARSEALLEPSEPPTTIQIISISADGVAKRTPRHLYGRQRRGGMGVFDLDAPEDDPVAHLIMAEESAGLILMTNQGRVFRVPVRDIAPREVRGKGEALLARFPVRPDEKLALAVPDAAVGGGSFVILVSERGQVRRIARQYLGPSLQPGTVLYDVKEGGAPAAACWSNGNDELFIVTGQAQAIRFAERLVPVRGCLGLRVEPGDRVVGVAAVPAERRGLSPEPGRQGHDPGTQRLCGQQSARLRRQSGHEDRCPGWRHRRERAERSVCHFAAGQDHPLPGQRGAAKRGRRSGRELHEFAQRRLCGADCRVVAA